MCVLFFEEQSPQEADANKYHFLSLPPEDLIMGRRLCLLLSITMQRIMKECVLKGLPLTTVVSENRAGNPFGWVCSDSGF